MGREVQFSVLDGEYIFKTDIVRDNGNDDSITFYTLSGKRFRMHFEQDCCSTCSIEDICGDVADIEGLVVDARCETNCDSHDPATEGCAESFTWTFYILQTQKGCVTIRWFGSSNGYYSETTSFTQLEKGDE